MKIVVTWFLFTSGHSFLLIRGLAPLAIRDVEVSLLHHIT